MNATPDLPDYRQLMLPLLRIAAERETSLRPAVERLAAELKLNPEQRARTVPGRRHPLLAHRAHWAKTHMLRAGLIERRPRGAFRASARGRAVLADALDRIEIGTPMLLPEVAARLRRAPRAEEPAAPAPAERIAAAADELDAA